MFSVVQNLMSEVDFKFDKPFKLESGQILDSFELRCTIYGELNADKSNAVLVFHALTGSSKVGDWWKGVIGEGCTLDTSKIAVVCVNYLGSCYGSTSAKSLKEQFQQLPIVTVADIVRTNVHLMEYLGIKKFSAVIGGSVGGMLALQFAADFPNLVDHAVSIAATPLSAMGLALNHLQRRSIESDDIGLARQIAMLSYKSATQFDDRFGRKPNRNGENPSENLEGRFDIAGYLDYQAEIFNGRFETESYQLITKAMDLFDLSDEQVRKIEAKVSFVGISSDWLFPASDVRDLAERFRQNDVEADYFEVTSDDGHDAFLSDIAETSRILKKIFTTEFTENTEKTAVKTDVSSFEGI